MSGMVGNFRRHVLSCRGLFIVTGHCSINIVVKLCQDAQADLSLQWAHSHFVSFVMRCLIFP